ncbi:hypothetical protein PIB30_085405 [Stylosanthes scabra]|uniref:Uncharacterized protein n=1 Tax=Stylosanthes scabra TaxID=79078 RepID=A0ABU6QSD3_9FABA|nr:hypothetical protein [Stylosanthes scabra]
MHTHHQKRLDSQLSHITELLHKFTNQPTTNPQPQPSTSSPIPSQPLPNPKGGINMVHNENDEEEDEEDDDEWLYGLLAELEDSDDDSDDEEFEEEPEKEVNDEEVEKKPKGETFFIATIFCGNEVKETKMPVKCEDPGPCLVTSKIRGMDIPKCLCDPGACGNVMPYALYETLDLGSLKKSQEVFTTVDASIVSVVGIADNVMVNIGKLTIPTDFHKGAHQLQVGTKKIEPEKLLRSEKRKEAENPKNDAFIEKGLRIAPPQLKKKRKKVPLNLERKKEKKKKKQEEGKSEKKMASKRKAPTEASPTRARVDKKGKKVVQTPPTRASARLAALKDSESEGRSKEENPERKLANTLRKMIGLRELDSDDSNLGFPYSTSSSSEEDDVLENDPGFWAYDDLDD